MTGLCGGGASHSRASSPAVTYLIGAAAVAVTVETLGLSAVWADLIAYAAGQTFTTSTFCATDPPSMPVFGASDVADIFTSNPIASPTGWGKLRDLVAIGAWLTFCECATGSTLTPPAAPTYPPTGAVLTPPSVPGLTAGACWDQATSWTTPNLSGVPGYTDLTAHIAPVSGTPISVQAQTGWFINAYPIPVGANNIQLTLNPSGSNWSLFFMYLWTNSTTRTDGNLYIWPPTTPKSTPTTAHIVALPANSNYWSFHAASGFPNQVTAETYAAELSFFCADTAPGLPAVDCCPPDPILMGQLQHILNLVEGLYAALPTPLSSYAESTVHAGLSNGGTITLGASTIAVKVTITTDNPGLRTGVGVPTFLFDRGYIVPIAVEGPIRGQVRLVYNPQLYELPPLADQIGYQLGVGIVASLTELVRGP